MQYDISPCDGIVCFQFEVNEQLPNFDIKLQMCWGLGREYLQKVFTCKYLQELASASLPFFLDPNDDILKTPVNFNSFFLLICALEESNLELQMFYKQTEITLINTKVKRK